MNKENQIIKLCRVCGFERGYDENHRLYAACKKRASIRCAKHYQQNREKILEKSRLYQKTKKNLNKAENQLTHTLKSYRIYIIKLIH